VLEGRVHLLADDLAGKSIQPGTHTVKYRVAAGLTGQAKAVLAGDRVPEREMTVRISTRPASARVDPETGAVVRGR